MHLRPCLALLTALLANSAFASPAPAALAPLLGTIDERLAIADQVALSKWDSGKPVEDRQREREVIAGAVALAPAYKLSNEAVEQFFSAQIEANKLVQYAHLSDWHAQGKAPNDPRPDLVGQIRPQLDQLQKNACCNNWPISALIATTRSARPGWPRPIKPAPTRHCANSPKYAPPLSCAAPAAEPDCRRALKCSMLSA